MVTAAIASRPLPGSAPAPLKRARRSTGTWVMIGVPVLLGLVFAWQIGTNLLHTETIVRSAVAISRVSLESDPLGSRIDLVLVDRVGQDTTFSGAMSIKLREPDGTVWQSTRDITAAEFAPIQPAGSWPAAPATRWSSRPRIGCAPRVVAEQRLFPLTSSQPKALPFPP